MSESAQISQELQALLDQFRPVGLMPAHRLNP